jgi:sulfatase modifying factor 1
VRKIILQALLPGILLLLACASIPDSAGAERPRLGIVWEPGDAVVDKVTPLLEVALAKDYVLLDRESIDRLLAEQAVVLAHAASGEHELILGRILPVDLLILVRHDRRLAGDTQEVAGLRIRAFETASSVLLCDLMVPVPKSAATDPEALSGEIQRCLSPHLRKFPARTTGVRCVALPGITRASWEAEQYGRAQAFLQLLQAELLASPDLAVLERAQLGASRLERFIGDLPNPTNADAVISFTLSRSADGIKLAPQIVEHGQVTQLAPAPFERLSLEFVQKQAGLLLEHLKASPAEHRVRLSPREEAESLFARAYGLLRREEYDDCCDALESVLVLDPAHADARQLLWRAQAKRVAQQLGQWDRLPAAVRAVVAEESRQYVDEYFARLKEAYLLEPSHRYFAIPFFKLGELDDGYDVAPVTFELRPGQMALVPGLRESWSRKRKEFAAFYFDLIEERKDLRMLHRPRNWGLDIGSGNIWMHLNDLAESNPPAFFVKAQRLYAYATGHVVWSNHMDVAVRGYPLALGTVARDLVRNVNAGQLTDEAGLRAFLAWLDSQADPLAVVWRGIIRTGLDAKHLSLDGDSRRRAGEEALLGAVALADGLIKDGSPIRAYVETRDCWSEIAGELKLKPDVKLVQACLRRAASAGRPCRVAVAQWGLERLQELGAYEEMYAAARDALAGSYPREPSRALLCRSLAIAAERTGRAPPVPIAEGEWASGVCLLDSGRTTPKNESRWDGFCLSSNQLYFCDTPRSVCYRVDLVTGNIVSLDYSALGISSDVLHTGRGRTDRKGAVCMGRYWLPTSAGLLELPVAEQGQPRLWTHADGFFADNVTCVCALGDKLYGISRTPQSRDVWDWANFAAGGPYVLFEFDPRARTIRNIEGFGVPGSRLNGAVAARIDDLVADPSREGLWVFETLWDLAFPHFYDTRQNRWVRLRVNAFDWEYDQQAGKMAEHRDGVIMGSYLYAAEEDALVYLPFRVAPPAARSNFPPVEISEPVAEWNGAVWGTDGRKVVRFQAPHETLEAAYVEVPWAARDGKTGQDLVPQRFVPLSNSLAVVVAASDGSRPQLWRLTPAVKRVREAPAVVSRQGNRNAGLPKREVDLDSHVVHAGAVLADLHPARNAPLPDFEKLAAGSRDAFVRQKKFAEAAGLPIEVCNRAGMHLRLIPPGTFTMGNWRSAGNAFCWRGAERLVTLTKPMYVGICEVTQGQWEDVMGAIPVRLGPRGLNLPAEEVSWPECEEFLDRLCDREGVARGVYRLLTEAEWEYACRAGTDTTVCFGDDPDPALVHWQSRSGLYPYILYPALPGDSGAYYEVGGKPPNAWGLHDMHGSVEEWCADRYWWALPLTPQVDPLQLERGWQRVIRGGGRIGAMADCWAYWCDYARIEPGVPARGIGLRVARVIGGEEPADMRARVLRRKTGGASDDNVERRPARPPPEEQR